MKWSKAKFYWTAQYQRLHFRLLWRQIAVVSQHVVLFNDTIANNIAYGYRGELSKERLLEVAEKPHVMEFVRQMPQGAGYRNWRKRRDFIRWAAPAYRHRPGFIAPVACADSG